MGTFGVYTFFVLSAATLMLRYSPEFGAVIAPAATVSFFRNRIARIIPLLATVTLISLVCGNHDIGARLFGGLSMTLLPGLGFFALHAPGFLSRTVGAWSIGIEIAFYLVFPLVCMLAMNASKRTLIIVTVILVVAQQRLLREIPAPAEPNHWPFYIMPLTFAPFFAMGVLVYRSAKREWSHLAFYAGLTALFSLFAFSAVFPDKNLFLPGRPHLLLMALSGLAVFFMFQATMPEWIKPFASFIGEISYSLYLTHWLAYWLIKTNPIVPVSIAFPVTALALAVIFTYGLERPARRWLARRRVQPSPEVNI